LYNISMEAMSDEERRDRATKVATVVIQSLPYDEKNPDSGYQILNNRGNETSDQAFARAAKEYWRDFTLHGKVEIQDGKPVVVANTDLDARIAKQLLNVAEIGKVRIEEKGKFLRIDSKDIVYTQPGEWVAGKSKILRIKENGKERKIEATKITELPPGKHSKPGEERVQIDLKDAVKIVDVKEIKYVKQGDWNEGSTNIDTSGGNKTQLREGTKEEYKVIEPYSGKDEIDLSKDKVYTLVFDHHSPESLNDTSATKELYKSLVAAKLLEPTEGLNRLVEFVTQIDNSTYPDSFKYFKRSNRMLLGLYRFFTSEKLITFFEARRKPTEVLNDTDLAFFSGKSTAYIEPPAKEAAPSEREVKSEETKSTEVPTTEAATQTEPGTKPEEVKPKKEKKIEVPYLIAKSLEVGKKIAQSETDLANMEREGFVVRTANYGITVIDTENRIPLGWEAVKERYLSIKGIHDITLIRWDPKNNGFFITSTRDIDFDLGQGEKVRGKMYVKNRDDVPVNFKLADLLKKVRPRDIELKLEEFLENESKPVEKPAEKLEEKSSEKAAEVFEEMPPPKHGPHVEKRERKPTQTQEFVENNLNIPFEDSGKNEGLNIFPKKEKGKSKGKGKRMTRTERLLQESEEQRGETEGSGVVLDKYFNNTKTSEPENPVLTPEDIAKLNDFKNELPVNSEVPPEENTPAEPAVQTEPEPTFEEMQEEIRLAEKNVAAEALKRIEDMEAEGLVINTRKYGRTAIDLENQIPMSWDRYIENKYDTLITWDPENNQFVIDSKYDLNFDLPQGEKQGKMYAKFKEDGIPLNLKLKDILDTMNGAGRYAKEGKLKEYLANEGRNVTPARTDFDLKDILKNLPKAPEKLPQTGSINPYAVEPETRPASAPSLYELLHPTVQPSETPEGAKENPIPTTHGNRKLVELTTTPSEIKTPVETTEQKIYQKRLKLRRQNRGNTS